MPKNILLSALMAAFGISMAQEVQTYSVYDTDQSGDINVGDAIGVANQVVNDVTADKTQQYVTAEDLRALLQVIDTKLSKLEAIETRLNSLEQMQNAIVLDSGIDVPGKAHRGHEYVDLGLMDADGKPIFWATCNVGASSPEEYGLYFAWGSTTGYTSDTSDGHSFDWANAPFNGGNSSYTTDWDVSDAVDANKILLPVNDAAIANWGGNWHMPAPYEQEQLYSQCYWLWVENYNGKSVNGYVVYRAKAAADKGKKPYYDIDAGSYVTPRPEAIYSVASDPHIFLPAAGYRYGSSLDYAGSDGYYWSSSLDWDYSGSACGLYFQSNLYEGWFYDSICSGRSVRPVCQ